jgi:hypothetical protein
VNQGQTSQFEVDPVEKVHVYKTYEYDEIVEMAFVIETVLTEGETVDLGDGISGEVSISWKNQGTGQNTCDPQFVSAISIGSTVGTWSNITIDPTYDVAVCPGNEGDGLTGVVNPVCGARDSLMAARALVTFEGGQTYAITAVLP